MLGRRELGGDADARGEQEAVADPADHDREQERGQRPVRRGGDQQPQPGQHRDGSGRGAAGGAHPAGEERRPADGGGREGQHEADDEGVRGAEQADGDVRAEREHDPADPVRGGDAERALRDDPGHRPVHAQQPQPRAGPPPPLGQPERQHERDQDAREQRPEGGVQRVGHEGHEHPAEHEREGQAERGRRRGGGACEVLPAGRRVLRQRGGRGAQREPGARPGEHAAEQQHGHARREGERDRPDGHQRQPEHDRGAPPDPVAEAAEQPEHDQQGERVDREDERRGGRRHVPLPPVDRVDDGGRAARPERERRGERRGQERGAAGRGAHAPQLSSRRGGSTLGLDPDSGSRGTIDACPIADPASMACSIARTIAVLGDRWALLVLREAALGTTRYSEFKQRLGIASDVLTDRLATLVAAGVLERAPTARRAAAPAPSTG